MRRHGVAGLLACGVLLVNPAPLLAFADCTLLSGGVDLALHQPQQKATANGSAQCIAANGQLNYEGSFSGNLKIHQVNPSIDYVSPYTGTGEWIGSLDAPADYAVKTCYQAFLTTSNTGGASASWQSSEQCTPDPPPPPPGPENPESGCSGEECLCSPIVINFAAAYQLSGSEAPVLFDIRADGHPLLIGWTIGEADEAFLALDRNANGKIDDGSELFGNHTAFLSGGLAANGFDALAQYDSNGDGMIDHADSVWSSLLLWHDSNHDGVSQPWELSAMSSSRVAALELRYHWTGRRDLSGNIFRYEAKVWIRHRQGNATPRPVYDVYFAAAS